MAVNDLDEINWSMEDDGQAVWVNTPRRLICVEHQRTIYGIRNGISDTKPAGRTRLWTGAHRCHVIASVKKQDCAPTREHLRRSCQRVVRGAVTQEFLNA